MGDYPKCLGVSSKGGLGLGGGGNSPRCLVVSSNGDNPKCLGVSIDRGDNPKCLDKSF